MTTFDIAVTMLVLLWFGLAIYLKATKRKLQDLLLDIRDMIKSMRNTND